MPRWDQTGKSVTGEEGGKGKEIVQTSIRSDTWKEGEGIFSGFAA